jgi:hypothetical protein
LLFDGVILPRLEPSSLGSAKNHARSHRTTIGIVLNIVPPILM